MEALLTPPEETIVRVRPLKIIRAIGNLLDKREVSVIYYKDEEQMDILFGFYRLPAQLDFDQEIKMYRESHPKVQTLSQWLVADGAKDMRWTNRRYRRKAQRGSQIVRMIPYGAEPKKEVVPKGQNPIRIDLEKIEARKHLLEW